MKVLCICCSPRKASNTEILLREVMKGAQEYGAETELLSVRGKNIHPCTACDKCRTTHECPIKDDMQEFYAKLIEADGIVFGTPLYNYTITAQGKAILDRLYAWYLTERLANKVGGLVAVGANIGWFNVWALFNAFFSDHRMLASDIVQGFATHKGHIRRDKAGMKAALELGRMVASMVKLKLEFPKEYSSQLYQICRLKYGTNPCPLEE